MVLYGLSLTGYAVDGKKGDGYLCCDRAPGTLQQRLKPTLGHVPEKEKNMLKHRDYEYFDDGGRRLNCLNRKIAVGEVTQQKDITHKQKGNGTEEEYADEVEKIVKVMRNWNKW